MNHEDLALLRSIREIWGNASGGANAVHEGALLNRLILEAEAAVAETDVEVDPMSAEALARALWLAADETQDFGGYSTRDSEVVARALIADPAPLLAALTEAGVLREVYTLVWDGEPSMSGRPHRMSTAAEHSHPDGLMNAARANSHKPNARVERRYVSAWTEVQP